LPVACSYEADSRLRIILTCRHLECCARGAGPITADGVTARTRSRWCHRLRRCDIALEPRLRLLEDGVDVSAVDALVWRKVVNRPGGQRSCHHRSQAGHPYFRLRAT